MSAVDLGAWRADRALVAHARRAPLYLGGLVTVVAGAYAAALIASNGEPLVAAPLVGALVALAVLYRPVVGVYLLLGAGLLFEQWPITGLEPLTAQTHFFENLSGISDIPLRLSACDLLALLTLASWLLRTTYELQKGRRGERI